ncbi:DeoR/GlpR family DNA-binding transcription regulator [Calidifontibacter terrae]
MYAAERQQRILDHVRTAGRVEVTAAAERLAVTTETVRRDLSELERKGFVRRVHGGAIAADRLEPETTLATRVGRLSAQKKRIAARALDLIEDGTTLLLDSGSTTVAIAELIVPGRALTVVTNSVQVGALLSGRDELDLFVVGGRVRARTGATVGDWAAAALRGLTVDLAFVGTNGISPRRGLTTPDQAEATVKRAMVEAARRVVVVSDSSKFGTDHFQSFATYDEIDGVVTDDGVDDSAVADLEAAGVEVTRA